MIDAELARAQMALSLAFHIVFAAVGVAMPALMVAAEALWLRTKDPEYLDLAKAWAKGTAVLFAVGAVSGTVLSFELGLLFPGFMAKAGALVGPGFALEGVAFFTEAIFLGIYLYGWQRVAPRLHLAAGVVVAISGVSSAAIVTLVNAWMQHPRGFRVDPATGEWHDLDPAAALLNPYAVHELLHSLPAYYMAAALTAAGVHAYALLRAPGSGFHRKALGIALTVAAPAALVMPVTGHLAGQRVAEMQPMKLAAMESQFETERGAPLRLGGIPTSRRGAPTTPSRSRAASRSWPRTASTGSCSGSRSSPRRTGRTRSCTSPSRAWSRSARAWPRSWPGPGSSACGARPGPRGLGSSRRSCPPVRSRSWPSRRAGSSLRSDASPGSPTASCAPTTRRRPCPA